MEQLAAHEAFHRMSQKDKTLVRRIAEQLRSKDKYELNEILTNYLMAYEGCYGLDDVERWDYLDEIFADAYAGMNRGNMGATKYTDAVRKESQGMKDAASPQQKTNVAATSQQRTAPPKYSIQEITGEKDNYGEGVLLDTNLFDGVSPRNWGKALNRFVYENLAGKTITVYDEAGNPGTIYLARENDRVKKDGANNSHKVIDKLARYRGDNLKAVATVHLDEALETSKKAGENTESKHQWMDEKGWEIRKTYLQDKTGDIYEATLNIANGRDRKILYDINNIRKIDAKKDTTRGVVSSIRKERDSLTKGDVTDMLQDAAKNVKQKFSLSEPVEQTKTLIAVHNSSWSDIYNAAMEWGGIPSPSVAIVKAEDGHTKFGDTSVVYPRSTIDPETDSRNRVYGADAWTPTKQNARVEREVNYDVKRKIDNEIMNLSKNVANGIFSRSSLLESMGYDDVTTDTAEQIAGYLAERETTKAAYLAQQGKDIQPGYKTKVYDSYGNDALQSYIGKTDAQELAGLAVKIETGERLTQQELENARKTIRESYEKTHSRLLNWKPELKEKRLNKHMEGVTDLRVEDFISHAWEYYQSGEALPIWGVEQNDSDCKTRGFELCLQLSSQYCIAGKRRELVNIKPMRGEII